MNQPADPYKYFRIEARELLDGLQKGMLDLERGHPTREVAPRMLRFAHTLKGAARIVKQVKMAELCHSIESLIGPHREGETRIPKERIEEILDYVDQMGRLLAALSQPPAEATKAELESRKSPAPAMPTMEERIAVFRTDASELDALLDDISNAYIQLESLRGALGEVQRLDHLTALLGEHLEDRRAQSAGAPNVDSEASRGGSLIAELRMLARGLHQSLSTGSDQLERELRQIRGAAENLRLVPADVLAGPLERVARDAAEAQGKRVKFHFKGGGVRLEAQTLSGIQGALIQIIRNAIAHGIESVADRSRAGKPLEGAVVLEIARQRNLVAFRCEDDGRGVDLDAVRRLLKRRGRPGAEVDSLAPKELLRILFKGGITTSETLTEISGRGIGLDIVRDTAARFGGDAVIHSEEGRGSIVELLVPVSLTSMEALAIEVGEIKAVLPIDAIRETISIPQEELIRTENGPAAVYQGRIIPFLPLNRVLGTGAGALWKTRSNRTVLIKAGDSLVALGVDKISGLARVVFRPLPPLTAAIAAVAGATLDASGNPQIVLDPMELALLAEKGASYGAGAEEARPLPVLVIDDSLTTRMLEQSILETAGYEVDLAESAEEALVMAQKRRYGLFLVDLEMPGMDGFAFIRRTRADPVLSQTPSVLVTSRNSPEDKRQGIEAGARAYIVKSEFNQDFLLKTIRGLQS